MFAEERGWRCCAVLCGDMWVVSEERINTCGQRMSICRLSISEDIQGSRTFVYLILCSQ
jgi:hypothetical protein